MRSFHAVALVIGVAIQTTSPQTKPAVPTLTGEWTFSAEGYVLPLSLRQEDTRLTGTLQEVHGGMPLQGEVKKGLIHFSGWSDGGGIRHGDDSNDIDLFAIGSVQPNGSLAGTLVSTVGNLTWHAERKGGR
jgi:hypothetical protein